MGIEKNGRETTGIHRNGHDFIEVWEFIKGSWRMVWELIRSCFGRGFWVNEQPWNNEDGWKNN